MFHHSINTEFDSKTAFNWMLMYFLAGSINAGGFLACSRFVTHTTGFSTIIGIDFALGSWEHAFAIMLGPIFFIVGSMVSAWFTIRRESRGLRPKFALIMGVISCCVGAVTLFGMLGWLGGWRDPQLNNDYPLIVLLCLASGLQNSALSLSSRSTIRATHLTGLTTDLGIGFVEAFEARGKPLMLRQVQRRNLIRFGGILFFTIGGFIGALAFIDYEYAGFLLPTLMAVYSIFVARRSELRIGTIT